MHLKALNLPIFFQKSQVCGQGQAPTICCVVANIDNDDDNFEEGATDIFTGNDLKECNNFDLGNVVSPDQFSK